MPIYEFCCKRCDAAFEELVRSPSARVACPRCGGRRLQRLLSRFGIGRGASSSSTAAPKGRSCGSGG